MAAKGWTQGAIVIMVKFLHQREDGTYQFRRKIPTDLRSHYGGRELIRFSLRTKDLKEAASLADSSAQEQDALWKALRNGAPLTPPEVRKAAQGLIAKYRPTPETETHPDYPGEVRVWSKADVLDSRMEDADDPLFRTAIYDEAARLLSGEKTTPLFSEALEVYLKEHPKGGNKKFEDVTRLGVGLVTYKLGDRPLDQYSRREVAAWRDGILRTTTTGTFKRRLGSIKAVFNTAIREFSLQIVNPFEKLTIRGDGLDSKTREPFTINELKLIVHGCHKLDDDIRWIVGLMVETGARLGEIVGLRKDDIDLSTRTLKIRPHPKLGRTLKTPQSERDLPLVGISLWAAEQAKKHTSEAWLFPRYAQDHNINATHASNTINRWFKGLTKTGKGTHGFRHSMRDRLRAVSCPEDIAEQIGGWGSRKVSQGYGKGYTLQVLAEWLEKVALDKPS